MIALLLALSAPVVLVMLAIATIEVRTAWGGSCPAHPRYAWVRATGHSRGKRARLVRAGMLSALREGE